MTPSGEAVTPETAALIVAAGEGRRLGGGIPKAFLQLGGTPVFLWSLRVFEEAQDIGRTVLVVPADYCELAQSLAHAAGITKLAAVVAGGTTRTQSAFAGLQALSSMPPALVTIHDGARPFVSLSIIARTIAAARQSGAAIAARPVTDTLKQVGEDGVIIATADRTSFWQAQTPQTFRFTTIFQAYGRALEDSGEATDDATLVERMGEKVTVVEDDPGNFKITLPQDWARAQAQLTVPGQMRVGHGFDVHRLGGGRRLMLGGVEVPFDRGLAGHSDADVVLHAVADALLGGAALGDIGRHFPDTDATFEDADSADLLAEVLRLIGDEGYHPVNVDVTVMAQQPRLAPHIPEMRHRIASILQLAEAAVSVKATTTEELGFIGREEGIAAEAVVLLASLTAGEASQT